MQASPLPVNFLHPNQELRAQIRAAVEEYKANKLTVVEFWSKVAQATKASKAS